MPKGPVTVWWGIPCKSAVPVFRSLVERHGRDVMFVALSDLPEHRRKLGWTKPPSGEMPLVILSEDGWQHRIKDILASRHGLHITNGLYHDKRVNYVAKQLKANKQRYGVIMEAPSNLEVGLRRLVKSVVAPMVNPLRAWRFARSAEFVLSASGERQNAFQSLGFPPDRIFPYGYFPDYPVLKRDLPLEARQLKILCIGYLEPFKGHDILLDALGMLRAREVRFDCVITGFGSARESLQTKANQLNLGRSVAFAGVVSDQELSNLFRTSHVLVAPGIEEPWGIRVNEALLSGLPVVVSDGVGAKELIIASGAGEVFLRANPGSLATALERVWHRIRSDRNLFSLIGAFRSAITPAAAAGYIAQVLDWADRRDLSDMAVSRPIPPWQTDAWRLVLRCYE